MNEIRQEITDLKNAIYSLSEQQSIKGTSIKHVTTDFIRQQLQEFLDLSTILEPKEFRQLLVASIEKIEAKKKDLKRIHFSFVAHIPEGESSDSIPSFIKCLIKKYKAKFENTMSLILKDLFYTPIHYLLMIRFSVRYPSEVF